MTRTAAALCLVAVLALAGCGSSEEPTTLPVTTPTTTAPTDGSTDGSTSGPVDTAAAAPVDTVAAKAEFLAAVNGLVDPDLTAAQHAAAVEGGSDLEPIFTQLAPYLSKNSGVVFTVKTPVIIDDTAKADVEISGGGKVLDKLYPVSFRRVDGHWKITREGACSMFSASKITCPAAPTP